MPENTPVFYIVQLLPVDAPQLVKLGHTHNMARRLAFMRTTCPPASLVKMWQCLARHERGAIAYVAEGCEPIGGEVFRCADIGALVARAEAFFLLDTAALEAIRASTKQVGRNGARPTQPEMLQRIKDFRAGVYQPKGKQERYRLRRRARAYD